MKCRHCQTLLDTTFLDLGATPPSNAYLTAQMLEVEEKRFPLRVLVCSKCWLVQTEDYSNAEYLFSPDYAYFSSYSSSWLSHVERFVKDMEKTFDLNAASFVLEVAANDGYLLQYFKRDGVPCLGIEPTHSTASVAREKGLDIVEEFFGVALAKRLAADGRQADLMVANNVLAHVPDINDFVAGFALLLKRNGVATFEFPHLFELVAHHQFDTVYHEHFSYLSLTAVNRIFQVNGLRVFDVEKIATHGGSLRVFACRKDCGGHSCSERVASLLSLEEKAGMDQSVYYQGFQAKADKVRDDILFFLNDARRQGLKVAGYGAAAKGNTLLNYAGIKSDLIPFVVDRNPAKQGKYLPGSHIPVVDERRLKAFRPDYIVIFPWNLKDEVKAQLAYVRQWGARFVTAVPELEVSA